VADPDLTAPPIRVVAPKPKMTVYFALLIIALLAMLTACIFLYMEIGRFGGFGKVSQLDQRAWPMPAVVAATGGIARGIG
jgi:hypothetical protein